MSEIKPGFRRVTEIISPFTGIEFVPEDILTKAADRGTSVHTYIEMYLNGMDWRDEHIPEEVLPYFISFKEWVKGFRTINLNLNNRILEKRLYCDLLKVTGQIDLMIELDGSTILIDWKTSSKPSISWKLQGAAYKYLARSYVKNPSDVIFVHLQKDGSIAQANSYSDYRENMDIFVKCVELYEFFQMDKTRKKWE